MRHRIIGLALLGVVLGGARMIAGAPQDDFDRAKDEFRRHQWAAAAIAFEGVEAAHPGQTDALLYLGKTFINTENFSKADAALQRYSAAHPESDEALYLLAYVCFRENKAEDSLRFSTLAAKIQPPKSDDLKIVALDYVLLDDLTSAARYLREAILLKPGNVEALYALGRVLYQQNQFDPAMAAFHEVLRLDPRNVKAEDNLGLVFLGKNETGEAIATFKTAIEMDRTSVHHNEQPYLNLGILMSQQGDPEGALPYLVRAVEISPNSGKAHLELGKAYLNLNHLEHSERELRESARIQPEESTCHYFLGRVYRQLGKNDLAAREFEVTEELLRAKRSDHKGMTGNRGMPTR